MGRATRTDVADQVFHVLNRANARLPLFETEKDYRLFETVLEEARERVDMRILAFTIMPNHWHLVLYPRQDGDLSRFMNWLTLTHTQRWHAQHKTIGHGHLYQGRYKSFLCETDGHFLQLVRYVERNPVRANLADRADAWMWGSAFRRIHGTDRTKQLISEWPVPIPTDYMQMVDTPQTEDELISLRRSSIRGTPFGSESWATAAIKKYGLETTVAPRGRPKKGS